MLVELPATVWVGALLAVERTPVLLVSTAKISEDRAPGEMKARELDDVPDEELLFHFRACCWGQNMRTLRMTWRDK